MRLIIIIPTGFLLLNILASFLFRNSEELGVLVVQPSTSILRFQEVAHGCGGPNGSWITSYMTHTGKRLSFRSATFQSGIEANQELQKYLQGAQIQEAGTKCDQRGNVIGERKVAVQAVEDRIRAIVMWTQHDWLFAIETESLECALEFEQLRRTLD
jgi:hypothetical protein